MTNPSSSQLEPQATTPPQSNGSPQAEPIATVIRRRRRYWPALSLLGLVFAGQPVDGFGISTAIVLLSLPRSTWKVPIPKSLPPSKRSENKSSKIRVLLLPGAVSEECSRRLQLSKGCTGVFRPGRTSRSNRAAALSPGHYLAIGQYSRSHCPPAPRRRFMRRQEPRSSTSPQ